MSIKYTYILIFAIALACFSCSSRNDEPKEPSPYPTTHTQKGYIAFGFGGRQGLDWQASSSSRADNEPLKANKPESIGVWGFNSLLTGTSGEEGKGIIFRNRQMFYLYGDMYNGGDNNLNIAEWPMVNENGKQNEWPYQNPVPWIPSTEDEASRYKFIVYSPYEPVDNNQEVLEMSYDNIKTFIWKGIPRYSELDYMISNNLITYTSKKTGTNLEQVAQMMHLYSRIRFCFKLGPRFGDLRVIRLKGMELIDLHGKTVQLTVNYNEILDGGFPVRDAQGNPTYSEPTVQFSLEEEIGQFSNIVLKNDSLPDDKLYLELSAKNNDKFQPLASLFAYPYNELKTVNVKVYYDVCDITGQLLRENCTATNSIELNLSKAGTTGTNRVLAPGYYYNVNIRIEPSFLYALSDNDFDADGYLIFKDAAPGSGGE